MYCDKVYCYLEKSIDFSNKNECKVSMYFIMKFWM